MKKYGSKLYTPKKPYYQMTIKELCDHNKICRSLDKMKYKKIKKLENLKPEILDLKIKNFLERNKRNKTRKQVLKKANTRKANKKRNGKSRKRNIKMLKKSVKSKEIL